jgi:hypothetical protein
MHSSFVIWGTDNHRWVAYAFADTEFNDEPLGDKILPYDGAHVDPISETEAKFPIWDAREYFLKVFQLRISQVLEEWEGLVLPVKRSIDEYVCSHFPQSAMSTTVSGITNNLNRENGILPLYRTSLERRNIVSKM